MSSVSAFVLAMSLATQPPAQTAGQPPPPPPPPAQAQGQAADAGATAAAPMKSEELEQLAAPIALYPDALLAQVLMASTYPLEVVQAARWAKEHSKLKGEE